MKRYILVDSKIVEDKQTKDKLLFLTMYRLGSKMKNGGIWHPKKDESISCVCFHESKDKLNFDMYKDIYPGALFDITFGINDITQKVYVATCTLVSGTNMFTAQDVYL